MTATPTPGDLSARLAHTTALGMPAAPPASARADAA